MPCRSLNSALSLWSTFPPWIVFRLSVAQQGDIEVIEFVEAYMEVLTALGDAENDLYSANFAEYAGGGGMKASRNTEIGIPVLRYTFHSKVVGLC